MSAVARLRIVSPEPEALILRFAAIDLAVKAMLGREHQKSTPGSSDVGPE